LVILNWWRRREVGSIEGRSVIIGIMMDWWGSLRSRISSIVWVMIAIERISLIHTSTHPVHLYLTFNWSFAFLTLPPSLSSLFLLIFYSLAIQPFRGNLDLNTFDFF
jgi:hypothetical protein